MGQLQANVDIAVLVALSCATLVGLHLWLKHRTGRSGLPWAVWPMVFVVLGCGALMASRVADDTTAKLKRAVLGFAPTYALEIERLGHTRITLQTAADDPTYLSIIAAEKRWLAANPAINDIYTFRRKEPGVAYMIVDSETDYDHNGRYQGDRETRTAIAEVWRPQGTTVDAAYAGTGGFDAQPYTDRWGTWVSAYWPLRDANGRVEGVVGVDYAAAAWANEIVAARLGAIAVTSVVLLILVTATLVATLQRAELAARQAVADALRAARDAAESANALKSQFLACMSHEIRTPMNGVMGMTELLLSTSLDDKQRHFAQLISRSGTALLNVINDILDYSKIEANKLTLEAITFDPVELIEDVVELLGGRAQEKGLRFNTELPIDSPHAVRGDPSRLRQVLINLVGNAVKFTPQGSVDLVVTWQRLENEFICRCEVRDTGDGVDPAHGDALFEPFVQADNTITRRFGGTGLGLAISKRITDLMGGTIGWQPRSGGGSVFWFQVPLQSVTTELPAIVPSRVIPAHAPLRGHVLVAEDNPINQLIAAETLKLMGLDVALAADGHRALAALTQPDVQFDAVLMDCEMPGLDGRSATRLVREFEAANRQRRRVPIIALTAHAHDSDRDACLAAGMDDYLSKPFTATALRETLARWLIHGNVQTAAD